jgi:hypothetical protein
MCRSPGRLPDSLEQQSTHQRAALWFWEYQPLLHEIMPLMLRNWGAEIMCDEVGSVFTAYTERIENLLTPLGSLGRHPRHPVPFLAKQWGGCALSALSITAPSAITTKR